MLNIGLYQNLPMGFIANYVMLRAIVLKVLTSSSRALTSSLINNSDDIIICDIGH